MPGTHWADIQQKTFTRWCNDYLSERGMHIDDLSKDLSNGLALINLMEVLDFLETMFLWLLWLLLLLLLLCCCYARGVKCAMWLLVGSLWQVSWKAQQAP